jgi:hypothetical protein
MLACGIFLRFAHGELVLMDEVDLLPSQFTRFLVAQSAVPHFSSGASCQAAILSSGRRFASIRKLGVFMGACTLEFLPRGSGPNCR